MVGYLSLRVSGFNVADLHILNALKPPIDWTGEDGEGLSVLCDATQLPIGPPDAYHVSRPRVCLRNQSPIGRSDAYHVFHSRAVRRGSGLCPVKFRKALCRRTGVIFHALHLKKNAWFPRCERSCLPGSQPDQRLHRCVWRVKGRSASQSLYSCVQCEDFMLASKPRPAWHLRQICLLRCHIRIEPLRMSDEYDVSMILFRGSILPRQCMSTIPIQLRRQACF